MEIIKGNIKKHYFGCNEVKLVFSLFKGLQEVITPYKEPQNTVTADYIQQKELLIESAIKSKLKEITGQDSTDAPLEQIRKFMNENYLSVHRIFNNSLNMNEHLIENIEIHQNKPQEEPKIYKMQTDFTFI